MGKILDGKGCLGGTQTLLMSLADWVLNLGLCTPECLPLQYQCPVPSFWARHSLESLIFRGNWSQGDQLFTNN